MTCRYRFKKAYFFAVVFSVGFAFLSSAPDADARRYFIQKNKTESPAPVETEESQGQPASKPEKETPIETESAHDPAAVSDEYVPVPPEVIYTAPPDPNAPVCTAQDEQAVHEIAQMLESLQTTRRKNIEQINNKAFQFFEKEENAKYMAQLFSRCQAVIQGIKSLMAVPAPQENQ